LEADFETLIAFLAEADADTFLYRDFQSRNVMLRGDEPWFIDYQGGRRGPLQYDVAAMLYDAKAELPPAVRKELLEHYLGALAGAMPIDRDRFLRHFPAMVLIRLFQAMGAYGYRGFFERKPHFLRSVSPAIANLESLLDDAFAGLEAPELRAVCERICGMGRLRAPVPERPSGLTVHVGSFSYKRGAPDDPGGHGGGFVFDCRAVENPGRHAAFASSTGRDDDVIRFLERREDAAAFLEGAWALVERQVRVYRDRGFDSLLVHFGCTGGQHRSVYFAERLAASLRRAFSDVHVEVEHAEASAWPAAGSAPRGA
ncbi:MAG: RapZ C-terminal domain-containing protein, partial [Planctomycetota bacterium]